MCSIVRQHTTMRGGARSVRWILFTSGPSGWIDFDSYLDKWRLLPSVQQQTGFPCPTVRDEVTHEQFKELEVTPRRSM